MGRKRKCGLLAARAPWLPVERNFKARTVAAQLADGRSILSLYRALISLRNRHHAFSIGHQRIVGVRDNVLLFERAHADETFLIALNFGSEIRASNEAAAGSMVLSTHLDRTEAGSPVLRGDEGAIILPALAARFRKSVRA